MASLSLEQTELESTGKSEECDSKSEQVKCKLGSVWDLEQSEKSGDVDRFSYFRELVQRLAHDISEKLEEDRYKKSGKYEGRRYLYQFSLEDETEENRKWILFNWPTIQSQFKTKDFSRTKHSVRLVGSVLRHMVNWINRHYDIENPILYENRDIYVRVNQDTGRKVYKNNSFISF